MKKIMSILIAVFCSGSVMADSIEDMCSESGKVCACAASQLKSDVGEDDYSLYEAIGAAYLANKAAGMDVCNAWDAAVKAEAGKRGTDFTKSLSWTNAIGNAHRKAIRACAE